MRRVKSKVMVKKQRKIRYKKWGQRVNDRRAKKKKKKQRRYFLCKTVKNLQLTQAHENLKILADSDSDSDKNK